MKTRRQFLRNASLATLGVGMLSKSVDGRSNNEDLLNCEKTTLDYYGEGPFYTDNPPTIVNSQLADQNEPGERLIISGRVFNLDCSEAIPNAVIDIWHANDAGQYDNSGFSLRGITTANNQGFYLFETILPGKYLNGAQYRPSHIHFKITPPNFPTLTTQLYFEGDEDIADDAAASITSGQFDASERIIPLAKNNEGKLEGVWDIVVDGEGVAVGTSELHIDKGMVYSVSPNPFSEECEIRYGVFRKANVQLKVFDLQGREVAILEERELAPEKYSAVWQPSHALPTGHYFVVLSINGLQVHYLKVLRQ